MDVYHSWIYRHVVNTEGFMWTVVYFVFAINVFCPLIVWCVINWNRVKGWFRQPKQPSPQENGNQAQP